MSPPRIAAGLAILLLASTAQAQIRPSDEPPELPEFPSDERVPSLLPPVPMPGDVGRLSTGRRIVVRDVEVRGSTVFSDEDLEEIVAPFEGRELDVAELGLVANAITEHYVQAGFVTSGALIPDQTVSDGVVAVDVVEGSLDDITIEGNRWLRSGYLRGRIRRGGERPLNVYSLEEQLQLLQQKPLIRSVDAKLDPGARRGEASLSVRVDEARPVGLALGAANDKAPSVGGLGGKVWLRHLSLTRNGDLLGIRGEFAEGYRDLDTRYSFPLTSWDTTLLLNYRHTWARVVEEPFDSLDIESEASTAGIGLRHPLIQTPGRELWLGLTAEHRRSDTDWVYGVFPFTRGSDDGEVRISVLRLLQEYTSRSPRRVVAARSTLSVGFDSLGATINEGSIPDSRFVAWLLQLQLVQRLPERFLGWETAFRGDLQLASAPLLGLEQYALGGLRSVRGYRENQLVRDNGWSVSCELRIPLLRELVPYGELQLTPFIDAGQAWNDGGNPGPKTLVSPGVGLRYRFLDRVLTEVYWGGRVNDVSSGDTVQDRGWHFNVRLVAF